MNKFYICVSQQLIQKQGVNANNKRNKLFILPIKFNWGVYLKPLTFASKLSNYD